MKKLWLWIIWILIVIYIWYWVVLTSFSVNVTAKEQCYNETFECYRKCWTEKNRRSCLLFKQWYWKWIFLWWYSFVEAKIKDIFNKEEFSEYWLLQWPNGTIKLEDFEKVWNIYSWDVWNEVFYKWIVWDTPENAAVMLVFKPDEILYTPYEKNTVLPESHENDIWFWTNLETFRKVTWLKEASSEYVGYFDWIYIFNPYVRVYKTRDEEKALIEKDKSEIISNDIYSELAWIIHNSEEWTITLDNWEESITIMDRNLWADVAWTWEESYWYYFQRWNNHWFQLNSEIKTWTELVSREESMQYWPNNWYDSDVQFVVLEELNRNVDYYNYNYLASFNDNLRWWSWDSEIVNRMWEYVIDQFRWDTGNPRTERKWPCPEWFHVPSLGEIHKLFKLWIDIKYPDDIEKKEHVRWMSIWGGWNQIWREFSNDLLLPMAWWIRFDGKATPHDQESEWFYWMSSPGRFLNFHSYMIVEYAESYRAATFPVRCFKD